MTLSAARDTKSRDVSWQHEMSVKMKGSTTIYKGSMVALSGGYALPAAATNGLVGYGVAAETKTNDGSDGDESIRVKFGVFGFATKGGDAPTAANVGGKVFMHDDSTVKATVGTSGEAGVLIEVDSAGVAWVAMGYLISPADSLTSLASTANGAGASLVGIEDAGAFTSSANVEAALAEIYQHLKTAQQSIPIPLTAFREVDSNGDVGNTAANGGLLASDTTPIFRADAAESLEINWAAGNSDIISAQLTLPTDFDGSANATLDLWIYGAGTTDAGTFSVLTSWDGAAQVTDTADDSATKSTSVHKITATIAAADIPDTAHRVSIQLVLGTHATDAINLVAARLNYKRKLLTS